MLGSLFISGWDWIVPVSLIVGLGLILLFWSYGDRSASLGVRLACATLKVLGFLILGLCLLEPLWSHTRPRPGSNLFVVLADNSQGMNIKDKDETKNRGEQLRSILVDEKALWRKSLDENFQVRQYFFDSRLGFTRDFHELNFDGRATSLMAALRNLSERYESQPLAGILLFTDGNATDISDSPPQLTGLPPIYPVLIGKKDPLKDISVQRMAVTQTAFEDAPVTIQADVSAPGFEGESISARLYEITLPTATTNSPTSPELPENKGPSAQPDERAIEVTAEKLLEEQVDKAPEHGAMVFRFQARPSRSGVVFYRVRVASKKEQGPSPESQSSEATLANNSRIAVVDRGQGPYRILYVAGRPNWEFKFLNRALVEDDQVQLVALIRIARREPKFDFKGRSGESSNPLFRGFDRKDEETERYDQPVLIRLNTRDQLELSGGFPKTVEELFSYQAVIVDDLEADFFTHEQMSLLQRFISERGGGFLMLGGVDTFQNGKYARTVVGDLLPIYLDRPAQPNVLTDLKLNLTREGWLQPWVRLRSNEIEERARLEEVPPFQILNQAKEIKPGASVLATVTDSNGNGYPALVVQRYGRGRVAAMLLGDLWRWGLRDPALQIDLAKAWRQLARWLIADVPNRVELEIDPNPESPDQSVLLKTRVRTKSFEPLDNASIQLTVLPITTAPDPSAPPGEGGPVSLQPEPASQEAGLYESSYVSRQTGGYLAKVIVNDDQGLEVGREEAGWASDSAADEFRSLTPNQALLESLANQTKGELITPAGLDSLVKSLPNRKVPITETWSFPLWHTPFVFLLALSCFVAEWGLRRWKGLA